MRRALPARMHLVSSLLLLAAGCSENLLGPDASVDAPPPPDACVAAGSHIIYLNRSPTTLTPGTPGDSVANLSSLIAAEVTTNGAGLSETQWRTARNCVIAELAPYDITVTDEDPGEVDHLEIVVSDQGSEIGYPNVNGISPFGCPALPPRDVSFVFWGPFGKNRQRQFCETLIWAVAISAGMTDSADCHDVMWPGNSDDPDACGDKHFTDELVGCVEQADQTPRTCQCTGESLQSSHARMIEHYGASSCAP